jgi:cytoskeletal protein CcmA (bactofilin family)
LGTGIKTNRPALYLQDTYKPLAVAGTTQIKGLAILPEQGIRSGNIAGNSYYGTELVYGKTEKSTTQLPTLKCDYKPIIDFYLNTYQPVKEDAYIELGSKKIIQNSFKEPLKGFYSKQPITLDNTTIQGNIIIRSDVKITVRNTAILKDIIIAAPVIEIQDGTHGNFQAFAGKSINMGKGCILNYPSALVLQKAEDISTDNNPLYNKISIGENSVVKVSICYFGPKEENYKVNIFMAPMSCIKGEIYCQGNLELRGNVAGTVYTKQFVTNEAGTIFVNHLYNAEISTVNFPESFGGILLDNNSKTVMKWLY